jgi:tetrahydromethanopterin S-methyltransferase subunit A
VPSFGALPERDSQTEAERIGKMKKECVKAIEKDLYSIELDPAGYFVIKPDFDEKVIYVEFYNYDKVLLEIIRGRDARSIYWTILENEWVSDLSHAAYLGKELAFAELAIKNGTVYEQH